MTTYGKSDNGSRVNAINSRLTTDGVPSKETEKNGLVKFCQKRRNRTKQEKHGGKGIAIAYATVLSFICSLKLFSRKVIQKF